MNTEAYRHPGDKPFPWHCPKCRQQSVSLEDIPYVAEVAHDNRAYVIEIPALTAPKCQACGELVFDRVVDEQISDALRAKLNLLTPEQVKSGVQALGLEQREAAADLGVAETILSKWTSGSSIQSRAMDKLLRVYFASPATRSALRAADQDAAYGTAVVLAADSDVSRSHEAPASGSNR